MSMSTRSRRIARSSSLGDFGMVDQLRQLPVVRLVKRTTPVVQKKPLIISKPSSVFVKPFDQPPRKTTTTTILTIGSPEREIGNASSESKDDHDEQHRVGGFCENCYSCKKKIGDKDDVFMYSYLRAFCSPKCRDKQIALDKKFDKAPDNSNAPNSIESQWMLKMKNGPAALAKFV